MLQNKALSQNKIKAKNKPTSLTFFLVLFCLALFVCLLAWFFFEAGHYYIAQDPADPPALILWAGGITEGTTPSVHFPF